MTWTAQPSKRPSDRNLPDEPRSYSPPTGSGSGSTTSPPFKTKPTNFLGRFNSDKSLRGEFVIDPCIGIPSSALGDTDTEDRQNLWLKSCSGSVHADIWLLGSAPNGEPRRTTIVLASDHGSIRAQVHTLEGAAPFSLTGRTSFGGVHLALPRSFQGLLSLSTCHGSISLSDPLVQNATQLSQVGTTRRYFIGDFQVLKEDAWEGDQVEVEAPYGLIRIRYVDEAAEERGFLSRLFGKSW